jgi:hypothetical protein
MTLINEYVEAIRTRVCVECIYRTGRGICGDGRWEDCALNRYLSDVIDVVNTVKEKNAEASMAEFHRRICDRCKAATGGVCAIRTEAECALERYFPQIVEAVCEVDARWAAAQAQPAVR